MNEAILKVVVQGVTEAVAGVNQVGSAVDKLNKSAASPLDVGKIGPSKDVILSGHAAGDVHARQSPMQSVVEAGKGALSGLMTGGPLLAVAGLLASLATNTKAWQPVLQQLQAAIQPLVASLAPLGTAIIPLIMRGG